jgi:hypothetical protein
MIWVTLAALGFPLWVLAGVLGAVLWARRTIRRQPGVFPTKLRLVAGAIDGLEDRWPRRPLQARWLHDVLLVHHGLSLARTRSVSVSSATGALAGGDTAELRGLGPEPLILRLVAVNGASFLLAARAEDRDVMVGPFATVGCGDIERAGSG